MSSMDAVLVTIDNGMQVQIKATASKILKSGFIISIY